MDSKQINDLVKVDSNKYSNSDSKFEYGTFSNMNGKSGIYSIFNKITNKEYIGSTSNIDDNGNVKYKIQSNLLGN